MGADEVIDFTQEDPVATVKALTDGRGADVAIEALGIQETFENCLASVRPAGRRLVARRLRRQGDDPARAVRLRHRRHRHPHHPLPRRQGAHARADGAGADGRLDLGQLITHRFDLDEIEEAYPLFSNQEDGVIKVAVTP